MTALVEARDVSFAVSGRTLVNRATISLRSGGFTVVVGPNGAGKSTLLRLLAGELPPSAGTILYDNSDIAGRPAWNLACKRAVMAQGASMAFPFRVHEVVRLGLTGVGRALRRAHIEEIVLANLQRVGASHLADRNFQTLSGGEQQRVRFARVLSQLNAAQMITPKQTLFLDEPIASLDLEHQLALMEQAREIANGGAAVLAVLHDLNMAATFADEIVVMASGHIKDSGPPSAVITERLLSEVFHVDLQIGNSARNLPFVLPARRQ